MTLSKRNIFIALVAVWSIASWLGAGWYAERKTDSLLVHDTESLESDTLALFQAFEERLNYLASLPVLIARESSIIHAATRYSGATAIKKAGADPKAYWTTQPDLAALNKQLEKLAAELQLDVIFLLNEEGYSIASSNSDTPGSIVGTFLADRHYYQDAIKGEKAHQYAVGRKTNVPGLYYSAPIMLGEHQHGVIVVKSDVPSLQGLLAPYHAFLTDSHDVVVLSSQPKFLQHMLNNARFLGLNTEEKEQQYKRSDFPTLQINRWDSNRPAPTLQLSDLPYPVLMTERQIPGGDLIMHMYQGMPELATIQREKLVFALFAALAGFSALSLLYQLIQYFSKLRQSKFHAEKESERLHETLSEREQQLEVILNHLPLMVVARDPASYQVLSSNDATQTVLGLDTPLPTGQTYSESLNPQVSGFLTAQDHEAAYEHTHKTRELQLDARVLQAQSFAAKDKDGAARLLIDLVEDITQQRRDEAEIRRLAFIDTLTGLNNRTSFMLHLEKALKEAKNQKRFGALILIDLDAFKQINDHLGHSIGDELLKELAHRLRSEQTSEIFFARLASDEFVVVIDSASENQKTAARTATRIANVLLRKITRPYHLANHTLHITASLGIAVFGPGMAETPDLLLIQTDAAMYEAKRRQRGTIHFFDEATQKHLNDQAEMANRLRGALQTNDFEQYFQPQVDSTGRVIGVEALLRWHDSKLGRIPPSVFIPLAESLHLIAEIDRWVLKHACRVAGLWKPDPILGKVVISINVSAEYFSQDHFVSEVTSFLAQFNASPSQIMIEMTEGAVVEDTEANILKIAALHHAGLSIAIDDFGTGNSSLAYLRRFNVDQIKIDQRFVGDMIKDERSQSIVAFIIRLAHELGYETLAEGVEVESQRVLLSHLGCTLLQGFLFSKPVPLAECEAYIRQHP